MHGDGDVQNHHFTYITHVALHISHSCALHRIVLEGHEYFGWYLYSFLRTTLRVLKLYNSKALNLMRFSSVLSLLSQSCV